MLQLCHKDLTPGNTLAQDGVITGVIDWEWAAMTVLDEDVSEMLDNWAQNEMEVNYLKECMNIFLPHDFWSQFEKRQRFFVARDHLNRLTYYTEWFYGRPEEAETYVEGLVQRVRDFFNVK